MIENFNIRFSTLVDEHKGNANDIAKGLHVSKQTISAWKSGTRSPKQPTIEAIARFFGVSVEWLMGLDVPRGAYVLRTPDRDRLEALHQNPRLGLLFDRAARMSDADVEIMLQLADRITKELDDDP